MKRYCRWIAMIGSMALLLITGLAGAEEVTTELQPTKKYRNNQYNYEMTIPVNWRIHWEEESEIIASPDRKLVVVTFWSPENRTDKHGLFLLDELFTEEKAEVLRSAEQQFVQSSGGQVQIHSSDYITLQNGRQAICILAEGPTGPMLFAKVYRGKGSAQVVISAQTPEDFFEHLDTLLTIVESLHVK